MYKLLLVSDQEDVLNAFGQISNWELHGFKPPHIRHDYDGAVDSLAKHHADGICIAVDHDEEEKILAYLQENYPDVSIFEAGRSEDEVLRYLSELKILLNRLHRNMRLLRSRMDADRPCLLIEIAQSAPFDKLEGRWHYGKDRLEVALRNSFAGDKNGIHILPTIHSDGRILVLACPLHGVETEMTLEALTVMLTNYTAESIEHMKEFFGVELHIVEIRVLPALNSLCCDTDE